MVKCRLSGAGARSIGAPKAPEGRMISLVYCIRGTEVGMSESLERNDVPVGGVSDHLSELPEDYVPSDSEPFMSDRQLRYFEKLLRDWKASILNEARGTLDQLQDGPIREPDLNDRASSETDWGIELRTRDRQRKLIAKIDAALLRIREGEYGYCEVSGEPISLARLRARPIATMTVEAQERHERNERVSRDD